MAWVNYSAHLLVRILTGVLKPDIILTVDEHSNSGIQIMQEQ